MKDTAEHPLSKSNNRCWYHALTGKKKSRKAETSHRIKYACYWLMIILLLFTHMIHNYDKLSIKIINHKWQGLEDVMGSVITHKLTNIYHLVIKYYFKMYPVYTICGHEEYNVALGYCMRLRLLS